MSQLKEQPNFHKYEIETSLKEKQDRIMRLRQVYPFSNKSYGGEH